MLSFSTVALLVLASPGLPAGEVTVMSYNVRNYFVSDDNADKVKSESSKKAVAAMVKSVYPDVLVAIELGGEKALSDFVAVLDGVGCRYAFSEEMTGDDKDRHLAVIAKIPPLVLEKKNDLRYKITPKADDRLRPENVPVQRGFIHAVFVFEGGYRLHIVGAHLKSRLFHPRYNQTDMRRYEARLLRYFVSEIMEKEPGANILVVGDMNDVYGSDPMASIRTPGKKAEQRLYDLRPRDDNGETWTHWWNSDDVYGRIDYAFASEPLLPDIVFEKTKIAHLPEDWKPASDHRPVVVTISTSNSPPWTAEKTKALFPEGIYGKK